MPSVRRSYRLAVAGLLAAATGLSLALALGAAQAHAGAASTSAAAALPPITPLPAAGVTAPPAAAIGDPRRPEAACGDWYAQSSYFGQPTGSTWWEYTCRYEWPVLPDGSQTNADWSGFNVHIDYFHWDGAKSVFYGEWFFDGYSDSWFTASYCDYWWDEPTGRWYGPYALSAPGECWG